MKSPCVFMPLQYVNLDNVNSRLKYELGYANSWLKKRIEKYSRLRNCGKLSRPRDYIYNSRPRNCGIPSESQAFNVSTPKRFSEHYVTKFSAKKCFNLSDENLK